MEMTNEEIRKNYQEAKSKKTSIKILADLNDCSVEEIKEILGVKTTPKTKNTGKSKAEEPKSEEKPKMPKIAFKVLCATLDSLDAKIKYHDIQISEHKEQKKAAEQDYMELAEYMKGADRC